VADTITELKLGNGTSVLIFANIASALPTSVGGAITQASGAPLHRTRQMSPLSVANSRAGQDVGRAVSTVYDGGV